MALQTVSATTSLKGGGIPPWSAYLVLAPWPRQRDRFWQCDQGDKQNRAGYCIVPKTHAFNSTGIEATSVFYPREDGCPHQLWSSFFSPCADQTWTEGVLHIDPRGQVSLILSCLYVFSLHDFEGIKLVRNHDSFELWPNTSQKASNTKDQTTSIISNWSVGFGCLTAI